jgi:hypothetical protein
MNDVLASGRAALAQFVFDGEVVVLRPDGRPILTRCIRESTTSGDALCV